MEAQDVKYLPEDHHTELKGVFAKRAGTCYPSLSEKWSFPKYIVQLCLKCHFPPVLHSRQHCLAEVGTDSCWV